MLEQRAASSPLGPGATDRRTWRALAALTVMVASAIAPASTASATYTVVIEGMTFNPPTLTIARGDRVTWVNEDLFVHTVTAASGTFDSHAIAPGTSWALTAKQSGEYPYLCTLHPTMAGRLVVR